MNLKALTIGARRTRSRHAYLHNDLTAEAIRACLEEDRGADQAIRNAERKRIWAEKVLAIKGAYPGSYDPLATGQDISRELHKHRCSVIGQVLENPLPSAELLMHPMLFRKPKHGNQGIVRFPHRRHQYMHTRLPEPPEAA